jgi:hypothetical protein
VVGLDQISFLPTVILGMMAWIIDYYWFCFTNRRGDREHAARIQVLEVHLLGVRCWGKLLWCEGILFSPSFSSSPFLNLPYLSLGALHTHSVSFVPLPLHSWCWRDALNFLEATIIQFWTSGLKHGRIYCVHLDLFMKNKFRDLNRRGFCFA